MLRNATRELGRKHRAPAFAHHDALIRRGPPSLWHVRVLARYSSATAEKLVQEDRPDSASPVSDNDSSTPDFSGFVTLLRSVNHDTNHRSGIRNNGRNSQTRFPKNRRAPVARDGGIAATVSSEKARSWEKVVSSETAVSSENVVPSERTVSSENTISWEKAESPENVRSLENVAGSEKVVSSENVASSENFESLENDLRPRHDVTSDEKKHKTSLQKISRYLDEHPNIWKDFSPAILFKKVLRKAPDTHPWMRVAARQRTNRLSIVVVQQFLRDKAHELPEDVVDLLPTVAEWKQTMRFLMMQGYEDKDLRHHLRILRAETDELACRHFLASDEPKPSFLLRYVLRPSSNIENSLTLSRLIKHCRKYYVDTDELAPEAEQDGPRRNMAEWKTSDYMNLVQLLSHHCYRLDPRFCVEVAELARHIIDHPTSRPLHAERKYQLQSTIFNISLAALRPQRIEGDALSRSYANAYIWEAQKVLLAASNGLDKPLLLDADGFRAVRQTLAGQPKSKAEIHSAQRQSESWPPYIRPGGGFDEQMDPEENWSRVVQAGVMMQEAGFGLNEQDDALNHLQGMTPDGRPTIQQRLLVAKGEKYDTWEASIRATRNAWEAWSQFQRPPREGMKPALRHYAAMFRKLSLRDSDHGDEALPGDRAANFPTNAEVNLTESEKARLHPPSIDELYRQMLDQGLHPAGQCLEVLVSNANSVDAANSYLRDSDLDQTAVDNLISEVPAEALSLPRGILSAYIKVCAQSCGPAGRTGRHIQRALTLSRIWMLKRGYVNPVSLFGPVLKNLAQHHHGMGLKLSEQLRAVVGIIERIGTNGKLPLTMFVQYVKCVRKIARRELDPLLQDLSSDTKAEEIPLLYLYEGNALKKFNANREWQRTPQGKSLSVFMKAASQMKSEFHQLVKDEKETQDLLRAHKISAEDVMISRKDPVRAEHAHEYMLALAYVGEFDEMAKLLRWLVDEWSSDPELARSLSAKDVIPTHADFLDVTCAFRLLAEPMLDERTVAAVEEDVQGSCMEWPWPDEDALQAYVDRQHDDTIITLERALAWVRFRRKSRKGRKSRTESRSDSYLDTD